jgi:transposase
LRRHDLSDAEWARLEPLLPRILIPAAAADAVLVGLHADAPGRRMPCC